MWKETDSRRRWDLKFDHFHGYIVKWREDDYSAYFLGGSLGRVESFDEARKLVDQEIKLEVKRLEDQIEDVKMYLAFDYRKKL